MPLKYDAGMEADSQADFFCGSCVGGLVGVGVLDRIIGGALVGMGVTSMIAEEVAGSCAIVGVGLGGGGTSG